MSQRSIFRPVYLLFLATLSHASAAPYVPQHDDIVLQKLPANTATTRIPQRLTTLTPTQRIRYAEQSLRHASRTGDDTFYNYAEAALLPWWQQQTVPLQVRRLRARIHQHHHRFDESLADLDAILARKPNDTDALFSKTSILTVAGDYATAKTSCNALPRNTGAAKALCQHQLNGLTGQLDNASTALQVLVEHPQTPDDLRQWGWSILAEMAVREGNNNRASAAFNQALTLKPRDIPSLIEKGWWQLGRGDATGALSTANAALDSDGLLVIAFAAEQALGDNSAATEHQAELERRFTLARQRLELPHLREEAQLQLLLGNTKAAHQRAKKNWLGLQDGTRTRRPQREPIDTLLLLTTAKATNDMSILTTVRDWHLAQQQQDVRVLPLLRDTP